ncbi:DNA-binding response regulator [Arcobacter sp. CECT 8989]|uniref:response regulator transcription factor n=1 Tax=Arcobacter sp. CECT 8989 TaxID=2044509 RepID=UPI00100B4BD7|nr:response regulator transcription factor [Arcobacter sp. CECT 8989]RXK03859.1 DNA-binding response regulator [Arcobacter sp. CECT 8989]
MITLLLVEDDLEFAELIKNFLASRSIETFICDDPFKALVLNLKDYDLVLLDLGLPGIDGLEVCKEFRKKSSIPIIISTARGSVSDKILGLQLGADDYLPKPYDPDELYARIISLLRRTKGELEKKKEIKRAFTIDETLRDIRYKDINLNLTEAQYEIFSVLIKNYQAIISREQIINSCPSIQSTEGKSLEVIISKIRQKIKEHSSSKHIISLRGKGYRVVE